MSNAFREKNTDLYRQLVTFVTGFGIVADQPFNIGSQTTTNSFLYTYNPIIPMGGIEGFNNPLLLTGTQAVQSKRIQIGEEGFITFDVLSGGFGVGSNGQTDKYLWVSTSDGVFYLNDINGLPSIDVFARSLQSFDGNESLNWQNRTLSGPWTASSLQISGSPVLTSQTNILKPFVSGSSFTLSNYSFYINTGLSPVTWTMPSIVSSTGRTYQIKNRGNTVTLTGNGTDAFFSNQKVLSFPINSGEAYTIANDSQYWAVM